MKFLGWTTANGAKVVKCEPSGFDGEWLVDFDRVPGDISGGHKNRLYLDTGAHKYYSRINLSPPKPDLINMTDQYVTRDGRPVRVLCVDAPGARPVVAIVGPGLRLYSAEGKFWDLGDDGADLIKVEPETTQYLWVGNVPRDLTNIPAGEWYVEVRKRGGEVISRELKQK